MQTKTKMSGYETASAKLYLINLLHAGPGKFDTVYQAELLHNKIALICKKLTGEEVQALVDRIENIL